MTVNTNDWINWSNLSTDEKKYVKYNSGNQIKLGVISLVSFSLKMWIGGTFNRCQSFFSYRKDGKCRSCYSCTRVAAIRILCRASVFSVTKNSGLQVNVLGC